MDFIISDEGELLKYSGTGGDVVIPEGVRFIARSGVFDPEIKITSLHIPSTLLGHKDSSLNHGEYACYPKDSPSYGEIRETSNFGVHDYPECEAIFEPLNLDLPYLENYFVAEGNDVYSVQKGLLVFNKTFVVDIPKCTLLPISFDCSYHDYMIQDGSEDFSACPVNFYLENRSFNQDLFDFLTKEFRNHVITIWALNSSEIDLDLDNVEFCRYLNYCPILVAPKLDLDKLDCLHRDKVTMMALIGYLRHKELFNEEQALKCRQLLASKEKELYYEANLECYPHEITGYRFPFRPDSTEVTLFRYYENLWSQHKLPEDKVLHYLKKTPYRYLMEVSLYGNAADITKALEYIYEEDESENQASGSHQDYDFWCGNSKVKNDDLFFAIALVCRYCGFKTLKTILQCQSFSESHANGYPSIEEQLFSNDIRYWDVLSSHHWLEEMPYFPEGHRKSELRNLEPVSIYERWRCIHALMSVWEGRDLANAWACFYAYMLGLKEVGDALIDNGSDLHELINSINRGFRADEFDMIINDTLPHNIDRVIVFAKQLQEHGLKLQLSSWHTDHITYHSVDKIVAILSLIKLKASDLCPQMALLIRRNEVAKLQAVLSTKPRFSEDDVNKLLEVASEVENTEAVAALLDFQDKKRKCSKKRSASSLAL